MATQNGVNNSITGNAGTATALQNARTIGGVSFDGTANITVASATGGFTVSGGNLALGTNSLTMTGSIAATGARVTKGWFTDIESTNMPTVGGTSLSSTFSPIAGSASIVTVGTIGTGVWQGTTIKANYLQQAPADLGDADITVDLSNSNTGNVTNLIIDGALTIASMGGNWTNAGRTVADLGTVTTADINGGTIDGVTIGGTSAGAGTFTTINGTTITASTGFALGDGDYVGVTSNERLVFNTVGTIVATGADFRIETANVGTNADSVPTLSSTSTLTNKTLTAPKFADLGFIADANGNELIIFDTVASAVNEVTLANAATGNNPGWTASGGDSNIGIDWTTKGTGTFNFKGNSTQAAIIRLYEDTDDGSNYSSFKSPALANSLEYTLPNAHTTNGYLKNDGSGGLSWATVSGGSPGWTFVSYNTATNAASITVSSLNLETDLSYQVIYQTIADSGTNHEVQMTFGGTGAGTYIFALNWTKHAGGSLTNGTSGSNSLGYWRMQVETARSNEGTVLLSKGANNAGEPLIMMRGSTGGYSTDTALQTSVSGVNEATTVTSIILTASAGTPNWKVWVFKAATS